MAQIIEWSNSNGGWLALVIFVLGLVVTFLGRLWRKKQSTHSELKIEVIDQPTLCSSFDSKNVDENFRLHRTAFLIYLKITNVGNVPIQIDDIHLGYRSEGADDPESYRWITSETTMLEDYKLPMIDNKFKIFPFLKQSNADIPNSSKTYLLSGQCEIGLVYFEQEESKGKDYPYMDKDFTVSTKIRVHDTNGHCWETDAAVVKVKIDAIREHNPYFGLTREFIETNT